MKKNSFRVRLLALLVGCTMGFGSVWADVNPKPFVIPELTSWTGAEGQTTLSGRIVVKSNKARSVAEAWMADCQTMFSQQPTIVSGRAQKGDLVLCSAPTRNWATRATR